MTEDTTSLVEKINLKLGSDHIFYVTNDPERSFGIENLVKNFHCICIDYNQSVDYFLANKLNIFCLEKEKNAKNLIYRNSSKLLTSPEAKTYIENQTGKKYIQVFKPSPHLEKIIQQNGWKILNTTSATNRFFEGKLSQIDFLVEIIPSDLPKYKKCKVAEIDFEEFEKEFGNHFVVQFNFGHTGTGTYFISSKLDLNLLKDKYPNTEVKVSEFIKGRTFTLVACASRKGTYIAGLSEQITGNAAITNKEGATVGNDFCLGAGISPITVNQIILITTSIGNAMYKKGFKGLFGIDLIIEENTGKLYIIEINARQPASTSFLNKIQLRNYQIPISLIHSAEYLDIETSLDPQEYSLNNINTSKASQIVVRNYTGSEVVSYESIKNGIYRLQSDNSSYIWTDNGPKRRSGVIYLDEERDKSLIFQKESYSVENMDTLGILITSVSEARKITDGTEVFRLQALQDLTNEKGELHPWVLEIVSTLKNIFRLDRM